MAKTQYVITRGKRDDFAKAETEEGFGIRVLTGHDMRQDGASAPRRNILRYFSSPKPLDRVVSGLPKGRYRVQLVARGGTTWVVKHSLEVEVQS